MEPLRQIREILKAWRERVEVLPAAGGALEDMLHPDAEEQEERTFTDERIFETIWERAEIMLTKSIETFQKPHYPYKEGTPPNHLLRGRGQPFDPLNLIRVIPAEGHGQRKTTDLIMCF